MKYKKWIYRTLGVVTLTFILISCNKNDDDCYEPTGDIINHNNLYTSIEEYPSNNQVIGRLTATSNNGDVTMRIIQEAPKGAIDFNSDNGEITVADSNYFDYELNKAISAIVELKTALTVDSAFILIELIDIDENQIIVEVLSCNADTLEEHFFNIKGSWNGKSLYENQNSFGSSIGFDGVRWIVFSDPNKPIFINQGVTPNTFPSKTGWKVRGNFFCRPDGTFKIL